MPWQTTGKFRVPRGRGDDVGLPPDRCPQLARADLADAETILARGRAALDGFQHLAVAPVLKAALPGRDDVVGTVHADGRPAIALRLVDEDGLAPARLAADESVDRALAPPLEEGGFGAGGVLLGRAGDDLADLDEVAAAESDEVGGGRLVDLVRGEGGVEPEVEQGSLSAFEEIGEAFLGEGAAGFRVMPQPPAGRGLSILKNNPERIRNLQIMAS